MVKSYCDQCGQEVEINDLYKLILPYPDFVDINNKTGNTWGLKEVVFCGECTDKLYDKLFDRKQFHLTV